ncbi:hypothetical protein HZ326_20142 [Fusarium oxysporum f. sp. albedinis]|nr:hypothetical protein HZ326_20142 [Fusarium oxysporum f. sp. albedinis]
MAMAGRGGVSMQIRLRHSITWLTATSQADIACISFSHFTPPSRASRVGWSRCQPFIHYISGSCIEGRSRACSTGRIPHVVKRAQPTPGVPLPFCLTYLLASSSLGVLINPSK